MKPWMNDYQIQSIEKILLQKEGKIDVLEWGSGGSTIHFTRFLSKCEIKYSWTSLEYNKEWFKRIKIAVQKDTNIKLVLFDVGNNELKQPKEPMHEYVSYPYSLDKKFDIVIIDGRKRRRCLLEALKLLKPKGCVILHDASRSYYFCAMKQFPLGAWVDPNLWIGSIDQLPDIEYKKLFILAQLHQGNICTELARWHKYHASKKRWISRELFTDKRPISNNRNFIVQEFLKTPNAEVLLQIDADVVPPANYLDILPILCKSTPIISGLVHIIKNEELPYRFPLVLFEEGYGYCVKYFGNLKGMIKVDATGTGCLFVHRSVLEHKKMKAPFERKFDKNGEEVLGQDFYFCQKAKVLGFQSYVHLDHKCNHYLGKGLSTLYSFLPHPLERSN